MRRTGTYTHVNGAVTLTWGSGGPTDRLDLDPLSGSIDGSQLTLGADGLVFIFRK
jgi:hypothetical protein